MKVFGAELDRTTLDRLVPDVNAIGGIRHFREENGAGSGQRVIRIESGGGLSVELLPDRTCDIGMVWCMGIPFGWAGPMGAGQPRALGSNSPLSGMMTTCGFDHIRQPETDRGRAFPLHGAMMHQPASILSAEPQWTGDDCVYTVRAVATQFALDSGTVRLLRSVRVPLGGQSLSVCDEVTVLAGTLPLMAMYHINFGFPLAGPNSRLLLGDQDVTDGCIGTDGIWTRSAGLGPTSATLLAHAGTGSPSVRIRWDAAQLPILQTLRNAGPGINLICLEPASHERMPRSELRSRGLLVDAPRGTTISYRLDFDFTSGLPVEALRYKVR